MIASWPSLLVLKPMAPVPLHCDLDSWWVSFQPNSSSPVHTCFESWVFDFLETCLKPKNFPEECNFGTPRNHTHITQERDKQCQERWDKETKGRPKSWHKTRNGMFSAAEAVRKMGQRQTQLPRSSTRFTLKQILQDCTAIHSFIDNTPLHSSKHLLWLKARRFLLFGDKRDKGSSTLFCPGVSKFCVCFLFFL